MKGRYALGVESTPNTYLPYRRRVGDGMRVLNIKELNKQEKNVGIPVEDCRQVEFCVRV